MKPPSQVAVQGKIRAALVTALASRCRYPYLPYYHDHVSYRSS